jgi:adenylate kinase
VNSRIDRDDCKNGFILDGYPRTTQQAEVMEKELSKRNMSQVVVHLQVDYNRIIARLTGRRQCPVCGTLYNLTSHPPRIPGRCDLDGAELVIRNDDREEVIRERLEEYERQTKPVVEHFGKSGSRFYTVDASDDPPELIVRRICQLIESEE